MRIVRISNHLTGAPLCEMYMGRGVSREAEWGEIVGFVLEDHDVPEEAVRVFECPETDQDLLMAGDTVVGRLETVRWR